LQCLLLPIWQKYRYHARFRTGARDPLSEQLFALIGLGGQRIRQTSELNWKRLLPYLGLLSLRAHPLNTFRGYRHLQEYFAFTEKFLFIDLEGLEVLAKHPESLIKQAQGLELRFTLRGASAQRVQPTLDNIRLYCTPIVNLFTDDAAPIRLDGKQDRYRVLPGTQAWLRARLRSRALQTQDNTVGHSPRNHPVR
jgi:hypothetical protein